MADDRKITYRIPSPEDGAEIWRMVDDSAALDANSSYAYFMICRNFAAFSVVAEVDGEIAGMVTAYPLPADPSRMFVWQVNVREIAQGLGVARGMLEEILNREECAQVRYIETTIEPDNEASKALFSRIAAHFNTEIKVVEVFKDEIFPDAEHKVEHLHVIGPILRFESSIQVRRDDAGRYCLIAVVEGTEYPAFTPANPKFSSFEDALEAAEAARAGHQVREVVIVEHQQHV